jgi:diguanylate cyclase (GGDEF)-like protein
MLEQLRNKLKLAVNFPSPPAVAQQIIELAADPDIDVLKVANAIIRDPGLTAKILRIANSPMYSKHRKSENLRQALVVLGLNATTTLALSFSLVGTYKAVKGSRIDYTRYWRRAILSASAARAFGELKRLDAVEDIFLASLLQDIAVLAIDRVQPDFYDGLPAHATHADLTAHEVKRLGVDHASLGSWLLGFWRLPEFLCRTVEWSHAPQTTDVDSRVGTAARCVALGSDCAEMLLSDRTSTKLAELSANAGSWLGIDSVTLGEAVERIVAQVPEIERLFDTSLLDPDSCSAILEQARELLMIRNLQSIQQVGALQEMTQHFEARTAELEDRHRRDSMTGVFNRGHLDRVLDAEFRGALAGGWPLSIVFADLDRFKRINDTYGHPAGDAVLVATASIILDVVRDTDCVARYGGEEFIIILPGLGAEGAKKIAERLLDRLRAFRHPVAGGTLVTTASLGIATQHPGAPFESAAQLLEAADRSVYAAKKGGRDRLVSYDAKAMATTGELVSPREAKPDQTCSSRSRPPRAAATLAMNAPISKDNAI